MAINWGGGGRGPFGGTPDPNAAAYQMPRLPWAQNDLVTTAALGLIGGRTLNEGLQNVAQIAPAGLASNAAKRRDMYSIQQTQAERARQTAAMNAGIKQMSGVPLTPEEQTALAGSPEIALKFWELSRKNMDPTVVPKGAKVLINGEWVEQPGGDVPEAPDTPEVLQFRRDQMGSKAYERLSATKSAYNSMVRSASVEGGAADLDIVYGLAKMLDPTGAVRDQDTVTINNTAGIPQSLVGFINGWTKGQTLSTETRNALLQMATQRMQEMEQAFEYERQQSLDFAKRMGFNENDVINLEDIELFDPSLTTGGTGPNVLSNVPSAG